MRKILFKPPGWSLAALACSLALVLFICLITVAVGAGRVTPDHRMTATVDAPQAAVMASADVGQAVIWTFDVLVASIVIYGPTLAGVIGAISLAWTVAYIFQRGLSIGNRTQGLMRRQA